VQDADPSKVLSNNLFALEELKNELNKIQDIKLNVLDFNLYSNNFFKKNTHKVDHQKSTLCIKIKKKNIDIVQFGVHINIGCDILHDYLYNKRLLNISLSFDLKNLCENQNMIYFINDTNDKSLLTSFITQHSKLNNVNLNSNIDFLQDQITNTQKLSFFLPIFGSYDNYDDFYEALSNVLFHINYLE